MRVTSHRQLRAWPAPALPMVFWAGARAAKGQRAQHLGTPGPTAPWQLSIMHAALRCAQVARYIIGGGRLEVPPEAELPGRGSLEGLGAYLDLMQRCWWAGQEAQSKRCWH